MICDNGIEFKNPEIEEMLEENIKYVTGEQEVVDRGDLQNFKDILSGFWFSLLNDAMMLKLPKEDWIDFTYETIGKLPKALASLYRLQKNGYSEAENADAIGRTIAATMYGLAMNEHGCELKVTRKRTVLTPPDAVMPPLWAECLYAETGIKNKVDFLEPSLKAVMNPFISMEKGLFIAMTPVIKAYKQATGVDLREYGLGDMMISG